MATSLHDELVEARRRRHVPSHVAGSVGDLAARIGMPAPLSIADFVTELHDLPPITVASHLDTVSGEGLHATVELRFNGVGHWHWRGQAFRSFGTFPLGRFAVGVCWVGIFDSEGRPLVLLHDGPLGSGAVGVWEDAGSHRVLFEQWDAARSCELRIEAGDSADHVLQRLTGGAGALVLPGGWTAMTSVAADGTNVLRSRPDIDRWLTRNGGVADSIIWEDGAGVQAWPAWGAERRAELREAVGRAVDRGSIRVPAVPANQAQLRDDDDVVQILSPADAWAYYRASVAQSLAIELGSEVPWSVTTYSPDELAQLFASRAMFFWNASPAGYRIAVAHGQIVPAPPRLSFELLRSKVGIARSRLGTEVNAVGWCKDLKHRSGTDKTASMKDTWQYPGLPPMVRVISGTTQRSSPKLGEQQYTKGCHGTVGLLRALLRTANVPVKRIDISAPALAEHSLPWFMADRRYLSHGDDPYFPDIVTAVPPIPPGELLIDQARFDAWFGPGVPPEQRVTNVGRQLIELALVHPPTRLLKIYCRDLAAGKSHEQGDAAPFFAPYYRLPALEAAGLWRRMDERLRRIGGCAALQ